jgi:hypothetical protein
MYRNEILYRFAAAMLILLGTGATAFGATATAASAAGDPPARVGRLSFMEGTVSFHGADQDQWSPATLNFPVTSGSSFWTEPNSKAEIEIGAAELRLDQATEVDVVRLDDQATQIEVEQGIVNIHLHQLPPGGVNVTTPRGEVSLLEPGSYHIDAGQSNAGQPADKVQVTVLEGKAEIDGPRSALQVEPGESALVAGDPVTFTLTEGDASPFDDWALTREHRELYTASSQPAPSTASPNIVWNSAPGAAAPQAADTQQYVSPEMTGAQDLSGYGSWTPTADYGPVWYPTSVAADWAPYRYGHWAFIAPWGWTWIDDAPWGFAPFHYGRWAFIGDRWGWCPGERFEHPVYAPALVAFIGGDGFGISIGIGESFAAVGWVPLGFHEPFHPYYHASPTYVRNVNITNVTNITNITVVNNNGTAGGFANRRFATVVPSASFRGGAPAQRAHVTLASGEIEHARVAANLDDLRPTRVARAGIAVPAAADAVVPKPGIEAKVASVPVTTNATTESKHGAPGNGHGPDSSVVPKSPGPTFRANAHGAVAGSQAVLKGPALSPRPQAHPQAGSQANVETGNSHGSGTPESQTNESLAKPQPKGAPGPAIVHHGQGNRSSTPQSAPSGNEGSVHQPSGSNPQPDAAVGPAIVSHGRNANLGTSPSSPSGNGSAGAARSQSEPGPQPGVATGQPVHHGATAHAQTPVQPSAKTQAGSAQPHVQKPFEQVQHPVQSTHIKPTPQGWKREPAPQQNGAVHKQAPQQQARRQGDPNSRRNVRD